MVLKRYLRAARRDPLWMLGWVGGFWLFGTVLVLIINATANDERSYACMGTLFSLAGVLPGTLGRGGGSGGKDRRAQMFRGDERHFPSPPFLSSTADMITHIAEKRNAADEDRPLCGGGQSADKAHNRKNRPDI